MPLAHSPTFKVDTKDMEGIARLQGQSTVGEESSVSVFCASCWYANIWKVEVQWPWKSCRRVLLQLRDVLTTVSCTYHKYLLAIRPIDLLSGDPSECSDLAGIRWWTCGTSGTAKKTGSLWDCLLQSISAFFASFCLECDCDILWPL